MNLGIPEAVLSPAIQAIARANGRDVFANFVEREVPFVPANTTVVTMLGGPNDTLALVDAIEKGAAGTTNVRTYIDTQVAAFGADYDKLVKDTQQRAPGAFIILLNMPNLAGLPFAVNAGQPRRQLLQAVSVGFSREANRRAGTGVVVVDLMCDPGVVRPHALLVRRLSSERRWIRIPDRQRSCPSSTAPHRRRQRRAAR